MMFLTKSYATILALISLRAVASFAPSGVGGISNTKIFSHKSDSGMDLSSSRRDFISCSVMAGILGQVIAGGARNANAADEDLTTQLFNEDGSLKEGAMNGMTGKELEAKDKIVMIPFPSDTDETTATLSVDGKGTGLDQSGILASYTIPDKWTDAPDYLDTLLSVREKACDRITVYQVPGKFKDFKVLEKATTIGVAKALGFSTIEAGIFPKTLPTADIVSGRKVSKSSGTGDDEDEKRKYYEFDMAVAPDTCGSSAENLGLGFCPYDTIVLLSATIIDEKMMVCGVTCTKDEWKRSNADLKRVRNSFFVGRATA